MSKNLVGKVVYIPHVDLAAVVVKDYGDSLHKAFILKESKLYPEIYSFGNVVDFGYPTIHYEVIICKGGEEK